MNNDLRKDLLVKWDAFKCFFFIRGVFISTINIKSKMKQHEVQLAQHVRRLEQEYISHPSDNSRLSDQDAFTHVIQSKAEKRRFFAKAAFFEEGEQTGRLIAKIVDTRPAVLAIGALRLSDGHLVNTPNTVMSELVRYYIDLCI